jgi:hypothetical protein
VDPEVAVHYGVDVAALNGLERRVVDDYDPRHWGLRRYAAISEVAERAVASDLLISLCEGAKTALLDLAIASTRYRELLGPNGRTMPGPDTTLEDRIELTQMESASTDCFRALGSALDCLAGLCVLVIGLPLSVQRAEGSWLLRRPRGAAPSDPQEAAWAAVAAQVADAADAPHPGWLAWALETRNAVIHRGQLLRIWLNRPGRRGPGEPQLLVRSETPARYLMRMEQHLRRRPWLPDMHAMASGVEINALWLSEPAQKTLEQLQGRVTALAGCVSGALVETWDGGMHNFKWPATAWQLQSRDASWRVELAEQFSGFEPEYPTPPPSELRMHTDSAKRPALAQMLRDLG